MGVGGSTSSRPSSTTVEVISRPPSEHPPRSSTAHTLSSQRELSGRPTGSCCSHYRQNHAAITRTVTPSSPSQNQTEESIDDEIEEIVANTLDIVANNRKEQSSSATRRVDSLSGRRDIGVRGSATGSGVELRRTLNSGSRVQKRPSDEANEEEEFDAKESVTEVDFAKFKKVNHKGATITSNGRIVHHQESDLLWRLGLISPEAYKINTGTKSAPTNQGAFLKTPSYDLTEEQLMANIEKEYEISTA